jgi:hypothetical protein
MFVNLSLPAADARQHPSQLPLMLARYSRTQGELLLAEKLSFELGIAN